MTVLPVFGFFLYMFYGLRLNKRITKQLKTKKQIAYSVIKNDTKNNLSLNQNQIQTFIKNLNGSGVYNCTSTIFNHSVDKIKALKKDIINAKKSINLIYYIFQNDKIGREIMFLLCKKAKQGVKVNLIYDAVGSKQSPKSFFKKLENYGGQVKCFFPSFLNISLFNPRYNYRNHKKIVVIDGKIGYFGGMNICLDKVNDKQPRPWKDIHYRVEGDVAGYLQCMFLSDFLFLNGNIDDYNLYFDKPNNTKHYAGQLQLVSSGPEEKLEKAEAVFIKALSMAKKSVFIQTPYFAPSDCFLNALIRASLSGVEVNIILPGKQDRKILQTVALYYASKLQSYNIKFYMYKGFLHSKLMVVDDTLAVGGSANCDNRSFSLNFELTSIFYDKPTIRKLKNIILNDLGYSCIITKDFLEKRHFNSPLKSVITELIAPFL